MLATISKQPCTLVGCRASACTRHKQQKGAVAVQGKCLQGRGLNLEEL